MDSVLYTFRQIGYFLFLFGLINGLSLATLSEASVLKKNANYVGSENFHKKKNPSASKYSKFEKNLNSPTFDKKFSRKEIHLETWDKHFSKLGQKKVFSDKSNRYFEKKWDKDIQKMKNIEMKESNWSQHLAKIRKDAGINLSPDSQILGNKVSYDLVLQNMGYFEDLAETMDLRSINRYQFRSNRPEGEIPVDNVAGNSESMN